MKPAPARLCAALAALLAAFGGFLPRAHAGPDVRSGSIRTGPAPSVRGGSLALTGGMGRGDPNCSPSRDAFMTGGGGCGGGRLSTPMGQLAPGGFQGVPVGFGMAVGGFDPYCSPSRTAFFGPPPQLAVRPPAPAFLDLNGTPQSLDAYQGRVLLLVFADARSSEFQRAVDLLESGWQTYGDQGLAVVTVFRAHDAQDAAAVAAFQQEHGLTFPVLLDPDGRAGAANRVTRYPTSFLIDRSGRFRQVQRGFDGDRLEQALASLEPGFAQRQAEVDAAARQPRLPQISPGAEFTQ